MNVQTTEFLKRRIQSAQDLLGVVKTMKALAAVSIRQYQRAVESLLEYNRTVEMGLQIVLKKSSETVFPSRAKPTYLGAIVFGTDQGLCGQFNNNIVLHAIEGLKKSGVETENRILISVGMRPADILIDSGQPVFEVLTTPGSTSGITSMVQDITLLLEDWRFKKQVGLMYLFYNEYISGATYRPKTLRILPIDEIWLKDLTSRAWESKTLRYSRWIGRACSELSYVNICSFPYIAPLLIRLQVKMPAGWQQCKVQKRTLKSVSRIYSSCSIGNVK